jgi:hypothetical protein
MMRRYDPAMRTVKSSESRLQGMAERAQRAAELLRTRVDVERSAQNQKLLESMDKRADLQLRLQRTVEGLSVVAISYYAVNLACLCGGACRPRAAPDPCADHGHPDADRAGCGLAGPADPQPPGLMPLSQINAGTAALGTAAATRRRRPGLTAPGSAGPARRAGRRRCSSRSAPSARWQGPARSPARGRLHVVQPVEQQPPPGREVGRKAQAEEADSTLSVMIASATPSVAATMTGDTTLGRMWRRMIRRGGVPIDRAASTIFAFLQRQHLAAHDPGRASSW